MSSRRFCAECGNTEVALHKNFCSECYWKFNVLGKAKKERLIVPYCLTCGALKLPTGWTGGNTPEKIPGEIAYAYIRNIQADPEVIVSIASIPDVSWEIPNPEFVIDYRLESDEITEFPRHTEIVPVTFKTQGGICTLCVKRKTGSDEVTVQFRAANRKLTQKEIDIASTLAFKMANDLSFESPTAYISDIVESYGGLDFYLGSNPLADELVNALKKQWIGHHEKNYKLVTEDKDNKRIYRTTHLFRIPEITVGDYAEYQEELYYVQEVNNNGVYLISLVDHQKVITRNWKKIMIPDPLPYQVRKLIVSEDPQLDSYIIMDMNSYEQEEIASNRFPSKLVVGDEIELMIWKEKYYLPYSITIS